MPPSASRPRQGGARSASRRGGGRVIPAKRSQEPGGGRYTPPIPRTVRRSPPWYPWVLLGLLIVGVAAIILNYTYLAPWSPNSGYLVGGILAILAAALMATRYR
jgi:hypothetical protein